MAGLAADIAEVPTARSRSSRRVPRTLVAGAVILVVIIVLAAAAPYIAPYPYDEMAIMARLKPPSLAHWFGTDEFGRDVLSRLLFGARLSLLMGVGATAVCLVIGVPLGLAADLAYAFFNPRIRYGNAVAR